jgi:OOP family OmpA-OmpF porin
MKLKLIIAVLAAAALPMTAQAGTNYFGVNAGGAVTYVDASDEDFETDASSAAVKVYYGHRFSPVWGIEVGHTQLGKAKFSDIEDGVYIRTNASYVAATGTWAMGSKFSLTGKAGISHNRSRVGAEGAGSFGTKENSLMLGFGGILKLNETVSLVAEIESYGRVINESDVDARVNAAMVSVGARFAF